MKAVIFLVLAAVLVGCASTSVLSRADGTYLMVATAPDEGGALAAAKEDAEEVCAMKNRQFALISHKSEYQGADKNIKSVVGLVGVAIRNNRHHHGYGYYDGSHMDDHRVELVFKCL